MAFTPETAWQPYEPSAREPWNRRRAAHLFRRGGFAANSAELDDAVAAGAQATVKKLLAVDDKAHAPFAAETEAFAKTLLARNNPEALSSWWLYAMLHTPTPLLEKMTLFWHGHFATSAAKVLDPKLMYAQNQLLRADALGSFEALVQGISRDPAMLIYLDSVTNKKTHPNENYAREVMELFCLGLGNYSEKDIQELARCFTGWEIQRGQFKFNRYQHDFGAKTVLSRSGEFDGDEGVRVILAQAAAPQFVCTKLVRFFVTDEDLPGELIEPLAKQLRASDLRLAPVIETLLTSRYFFSDEAIGRKIRSPVELGIGLLRALEGTSSTQKLAAELGELGQKLFFPPNVKGWDGGAAWINSAALLGRANFVKRLVEDPVTKFGGGALDAYLQKLGWTKTSEIIDGLAELLVATDLAADVRQQLSRQFEATKNRPKALQQLLHTLGTLPEFQLS
jgi:uncharacterized protein (DUF1800 family)